VRQRIASRIANLDRSPQTENPPRTTRQPPTPLIEAWLEEQRLAAIKNAHAMREFYHDCR
jgi:hypothetical protein